VGALFANPYERICGAAGEPPLPGYAVRLRNVLRGLPVLPQPLCAGVRTETGFRRFLNAVRVEGCRRQTTDAQARS
jgi:hypothetical protein